MQLEAVTVGDELDLGLAACEFETHRRTGIEVDVRVPDHERYGLVQVKLVGLAAVVAVAALLFDAAADEAVLWGEVFDVVRFFGEPFKRDIASRVPLAVRPLLLFARRDLEVVA